MGRNTLAPMRQADGRFARAGSHPKARVYLGLKNESFQRRWSSDTTRSRRGRSIGTDDKR